MAGSGPRLAHRTDDATAPLRGCHREGDQRPRPRAPHPRHHGDTGAPQRPPLIGRRAIAGAGSQGCAASDVIDVQAGQRADQPKKSIASGRHAQRGGQTSAGPASQRQADPHRHPPELFATRDQRRVIPRPARRRSCSPTWVVAEDPPHPQQDPYQPPHHRRIRQRSLVSGMHAKRPLGAGRAGPVVGAYRGSRNNFGAIAQLLDLDAGQISKSLDGITKPDNDSLASLYQTVRATASQTSANSKGRRPQRVRVSQVPGRPRCSRLIAECPGR